MKCELINREEVIRKFKIDDISLRELTIIETLIEKEIENNEEKLRYFNENGVKNKNTEWLESRIDLLKNMLKDIKGE